MPAADLKAIASDDRWSGFRSRLRTFPREKHAVAALEFAIVLPFLCALMGGAYELSRAMNASRRLTTLAVSASTMLATNTTGSVNFLDLHYAADGAMLIFPTVLSESYSKGQAWKQDITFSMAGVSFTPTTSGCTSGCTYKANIVWTGGNATRVCGTNPAAAATDTAPPTATKLPPSLFNTVTTPSGTSAPLFEVVVDVSYSWTPLLFSKVIGPLTISRSAYINPRYVSQINYTAALLDDGFGKQCPGF